MVQWLAAIEFVFSFILRWTPQSQILITNSFAPRPSATMLSWMLSACVCEPQARDSRGNVETGLSLNAERLQGDRMFEPANKHMSAEPDAHRRLCGNATIASCQRARMEPAWSKHRPNHFGLAGDSDIKANPCHPASVVFLACCIWAKGASHASAGAEDEPDAALNRTTQGANPHAGFSKRRVGTQGYNGNSKCGKSEFPDIHNQVLILE
jgi:hypothetical protein